MLDPKEIDKYFQTSTSAKNETPTEIARRTRIVSLAKLALPGLAAVLAVTLLLFPSLQDDIREFGLDFVVNKGDIEKLNVENTTIYLTDKKNRVNNFTVEQIKEVSPGSKLYDLTKPEAIIPLEGKWVSIQAPLGLFNQEKSLLQLKQHIEMFYSDGMSLQTSEFFYDFKQSFGYTDTTVTGSGFLGEIQSSGAELYGDSNILKFSGRTHIVIKEDSLKKE